MILDKEKYRLQRAHIKLWLENRPDEDIKKEISHMALSTGCPIIIVVEFVMEILGRTEELLVIQQNLMKFYGVVEVV